MIGLNVTEAGSRIPPETTHLRVWDSGAHWGALHVGPGQYFWDPLDSIIDQANGRHVLYTFAGCPRWLAKYPDQPHAAPWLGPGSNSMPWSMDHAAEFLDALADRYRGRIHAYEIWNEPQLADFLYPWNDAERNALAALTRRAHTVIKNQDPTALILAGSVLPRESSGGMTRARKYLDALARKDWPLDAFTAHLYPEVGTGYKRWASMLADTVATIDSYKPPRRKLWITETTYGLLGPLIPDEKAEQLVTDTYAGDGGRFVYWYAWQRPDLGGLYLDEGSAAWSAIKREGLK